MAESEKMMALKKAYAEMILNTAKEAARRVMASEKIAMRCKYDLFATKDEALRLLLRLKQMIDAKIIEAETASSSQQTKIDELEAQLQEAECVIIDLREELRWVRDKLDKARINQVQCSDGKINGDYECSYQSATPESNILSPDMGHQPATISDAKNILYDHRISNNRHSSTKQTEQSSVPQFGSHLSHDAELASLTVRKNEHELYRNVFTQRIRALEGNLSASGEVDEFSSTKSELSTKESDKDDEKFSVPSPKTKNFQTVKCTSVEEVRKHVKVCTLRRRTPFVKPKAKCMSFPSQLMKSYQLPSILSCRKRYLVSRDFKPDDHSCTLPSINNLNELEEKLHCQSTCFMDEKIIGHEGKRQRIMQSRDAMSTPLTSCHEKHETCQPSSTLCCWKTHSFSLCGNAKSGEDRSKMTENEVQLKSLPRLDPGLTLINGGTNPLSGFADMDTKPVDELVKQKCGTAANSTFSCYESRHEIVNVPLVYSKDAIDAMADVPVFPSDSEDVKASEELKVSPSEVNNSRLLKYTFQRKRKKEALSNPDQNTSVEKTTMKRRAGEEQNDSSDLQNYSMLNESSRDCRQLTQVARQLVLEVILAQKQEILKKRRIKLISLSGKRWW